VRRSWLRTSAIARRLRLERLLRIFPGVHAHDTCANTLVISRFAARTLPQGLFKLFGYRRIRPYGDDFLLVRHKQ